MIIPFVTIAGGVILIIVAIAYLAGPKPARSFSYLPADLSKNYIKPAHWKGTPVDSKGRFMNHEYPFYQNYLHILRWLPGHLVNLFRNRNTRFPVLRHESADFLNDNETLIWLGHSSFFLRISNTNILIDPQFHNAAVYQRHTDNPVPPEFFTNIKYILLSHDHADHCDKRSLQLLIRSNPGVTVLAGLNMDALVQSFVTGKVNVVTAAWYEEFAVPGSIKIYFVPARHYCKRLLRKFNHRLWGGFVIRYENASGHLQTIYYCGDSGYGNHFKDIKKLFNPHIAILPIGAYMPRWFMRPNHMSPEEALRAFDDCGAKLMMPMHYNTFNLSNENMDEPEKRLGKILRSTALVKLKAGLKYHLKPF